MFKSEIKLLQKNYEKEKYFFKKDFSKSKTDAIMFLYVFTNMVFI